MSKMRDFPSCFGENGIQVSDSSSNSGRTAQNLITCVYQSRLNGDYCMITVTWSKNLMGQGLSVGIDDSKKRSLCKIDIKPWLFSKRKGSKRIESERNQIDIFWDLSCAKFGVGPEPLGDFYLAIIVDQVVILLLGDLRKEAMKKVKTCSPPPNAVIVAKKEHIFGKGLYSTRAMFCDNGRIHDIAIECESSGRKEPYLSIRIDRKMVMQVKHLTWKFRGNQTILIDGQPVEVFWDVHNWLFASNVGSAVFMFQTSLLGEKIWPLYSSDMAGLPLPCSQILKETQAQGLGFSLILYAWKND